MADFIIAVAWFLGAYLAVATGLTIIGAILYK